MKREKRYWHELTQDEVDEVFKTNMTIKSFMLKYKQPDWCGYPEALSGIMGCWSLCDSSPNGLRTRVSKEWCQTCDCFKRMAKAVSAKNALTENSSNLPNYNIK